MNRHPELGSVDRGRVVRFVFTADPADGEAAAVPEVEVEAVGA